MICDCIWGFGYLGIYHDGEGAIATRQPPPAEAHDGEAHPSIDRLRGSLRSEDTSLR